MQNPSAIFKPRMFDRKRPSEKILCHLAIVFSLKILCFILKLLSKTTIFPIFCSRARFGIQMFPLYSNCKEHLSYVNIYVNKTVNSFLEVHAWSSFIQGVHTVYLFSQLEHVNQTLYMSKCSLQSAAGIMLS